MLLSTPVWGAYLNETSCCSSRFRSPTESEALGLVIYNISLNEVKTHSALVVLFRFVSRSLFFHLFVSQLVFFLIPIFRNAPVD